MSLCALLQVRPKLARVTQDWTRVGQLMLGIDNHTHVFVLNEKEHEDKVLLERPFFFMKREQIENICFVWSSSVWEKQISWAAAWAQESLLRVQQVAEDLFNKQKAESCVFFF